MTGEVVTSMKNVGLIASLLFGTIKMHSIDVFTILECHDKIVEQGTTTLSFAKDATALFGESNVDHFISNFGGASPIWNSVAYFAGRYSLSLRVPITIDYENCKLTDSRGTASVQINETVEVNISTSGIAGATEKGQWRLSETEWKLLANSKGDWSILGVPIVTNSPVDGFEELVRQIREPIRNRKEGFDDPIKRKLQVIRDRQANKTNQANSSRAVGSTNEVGCYEKVVRHGVENLILPGEVNSLVGATNVDHFISKFGSKAQTPVWHSVAYFAGRYRLVLQFPIRIDYEKCRIGGAVNSALVQIDEITAVDVSKRGVAEAKTRGQWRLNENEWRWLFKNQGDWSVVKVPIRTNAPVRGFVEYVKQERGRPVESRQEDLDRPIRKAVDAFSVPASGTGKKQDRENQ